MRTLLCVSVTATLLFSSAAFAQTSSDDDRFAPRVYGSLSVTPADYGNMDVEIFQPQTSTNVIVEPVVPAMDTVIASSQDQAIAEEAARIRAYRYGTSTQTVVEPAQQDFQLYAPEPSYTSVEMTQSHVVAKGDTLYNISKRYNTTVSAIQDANGLSGTGIGLGQALFIPATSFSEQSYNTSIAQPIFASAPVQDGIVTRRVVQPVSTFTQTMDYRVLPKDTLSSISRRSCVSVNALIQTNNILNPNALTPGQKLILPSGHCVAK